MSFLNDLVVRKIRELGRDEAAEFFSVSPALIAQWEAGSKGPSLAAIEKVFDPSTLATVAGGQQCEWEGKKVMILLPWYKTTHPLTAVSLLGMMDRAKVSVMLRFGDAFIAHSRNFLAADFLKSPLEWSLSIDDDMIVPCGSAAWYNQVTKFNLPEKFAGMNALNRLLSHNKKLVGALYFGRSSKSKPLFCEGFFDPSAGEHARRGPHDEVIATKWVATGCTLIHRDVFLDIEKKFPRLARNEAGIGHWFSSSEHDMMMAAQECMAILNDNSTTPEARVEKVRSILGTAGQLSAENSKLGMGEDVQFCRRAAQAGHQAWVDLGLICGHIGHEVFGPYNTKPA